MNGTKKVSFKKGEIICGQGDQDSSLYLLESGEAMVFGIDGTKVTPFAMIKEEEFIGELSYFDSQNRSAYVIAATDCEALEIQTQNQKDHMPDWMIKMATNITKRLRHIDEIISNKGIKRKNVEGIKPLSIDEQREIYNLVKNQNS